MARIPYSSPLLKRVETAMVLNDHLELLDEAGTALEGMLEAYCSNGCPDPDCGVCIRSDEAEAAARKALATIKKLNID